MDNMIYRSLTDNMECPKCGSNNIRIKSGMMADLYTCMNCGFESRDIEKR